MTDGFGSYLHFLFSGSSGDCRAESLPVRRESCEALDVLPCGVCLLDGRKDLNPLYCNRYLRELLQEDCLAPLEQWLGPEQARTVRNALSAPDSVSPENPPRSGSFRLELRPKRAAGGGQRLYMLANWKRLEDFPALFLCVWTDVTSIKRELTELTAQAASYEAVVEKHTNYLIQRYDFDADRLHVSPEVSEMFGVPEVILSMPQYVAEKNIVLPDSLPEYLAFYQKIKDGEPEGSCVIRCRCADQSLIWLQQKFTLFRRPDGTPHYAVISSEDITRQHEKEIGYERWKQQYVLQMADSIAYYEYNLTNDLFEYVDGQLSSYLPPDVRQSFSSISKYAADHFVYPKDRRKYLKFFSREYLISRFRAGQFQILCEHRRIHPKTGRVFWAQGNIQMVRDPYVDCIKCFVLIKNIHEQKTARLLLQKRSETDPLTGLYNRGTAIRKINNVLKKDSDRNRRHSMIILDIDRFKQLNDTLGHISGDHALCSVAGALRRLALPGDILGRLGGDEFIVFFRGESAGPSLEKRLLEISEKLRLQYENGVSISCSIGVACYPENGPDFNGLYQKADLALYQSKNDGRNRWSYYRKKNTPPPPPAESG